MNRTTILKAIQELSVEEQEELIGEILALLPIAAEPTVRPNSSRLAGVFNTGQTPPTDVQVAEWLDEHRQEKYERQ